jgi:hypothetical protein
MKLLNLFMTLRMGNLLKKFIILLFQRYDYYYVFKNVVDFFGFVMLMWLCWVLICFYGFCSLCRGYQKQVFLGKFL